MKPAIFLDRDNTLTRDEGYSYKVEDFQWMEGADEALRLFHQARLPVFIITNQSGIGRGYFTEQQMHLFNDHLCQQAKLAGGLISDIAFCPHHPKAIDEAMRHCHCRKPEIGMLTSIASKWQIDLKRSVMIGDRDSDVMAGKQAGCHSYLYDINTSLADLAQRVLDQHFPQSSSYPQSSS